MQRIDYPEDCLRIQIVCLKHNYYLTIPECEEIWEEYSDSIAASWLFLPKEDDMLWTMIKEYVIKRAYEID